MAKYDSVNSQWPEGTNEGRDLKPTPQEAMAAARRLYRLGFGKPFKGKIVLTSGNRATWIRGNVLYVNPDQRQWWCSTGGGWHEIVHGMSHYVAARLHGSAHDHRHAWIERTMIEHVVKSGWLDGKLRRPEKPKPTADDKRRAKLDGIERRLASWRTKRKRAETAIRKLERQRAYYEKATAS